MSIRYRITDSVSFAFTALCVGVFLALSFFSYSNALTWVNSGTVDDSDIYLVLDTVVDSSGVIHYAGKRVDGMTYSDIALSYGTSNDSGQTILWEDIDTSLPSTDWGYEVVIIKLDSAGEPGIFFGQHNISNEDHVFYYAHSSDWTTR